MYQVRSERASERREEGNRFFVPTKAYTRPVQNPAHVQGSTSNPHLRPKDAPPLDPNPASQLSEAETQEQFDKFCECEVFLFAAPAFPSVCF